jgi:hypothetical protein
MAGYDPEKSGKYAVKGILQNQQKLTFFEDDPRNNAKFRKNHPNFVFEGLRPATVITPENVDSISKHRQETNTKNFVNRNGQTHPLPGEEIKLAFSKEVEELKKFGLHPEDKRHLQKFEDHSEFLFHEILHEMYDLERDEEHESAASHVPVQKMEGVDHSEDRVSMIAPANLVASALQQDLSVSPQGGQPTWEVTLNFDVDGLTDDYEIRVIKIS